MAYQRDEIRTQDIVKETTLLKTIKASEKRNNGR